jgi:hypothetical protein
VIERLTATAMRLPTGVAMTVTGAALAVLGLFEVLVKHYAPGELLELVGPGILAAGLHTLWCLHIVPATRAGAATAPAALRPRPAAGPSGLLLILAGLTAIYGLSLSGWLVTLGGIPAALMLISMNTFVAFFFRYTLLEPSFAVTADGQPAIPARGADAWVWLVLGGSVLAFFAGYSWHVRNTP